MSTIAPIDAAVMQHALWAVALPPEGRQMLADGLHHRFVVDLFSDDLFPALIQTRIGHAVNSSARSLGGGEIFSRKVEAMFDGTDSDFNVYGAISVAPVKSVFDAARMANDIGEPVSRRTSAVWNVTQLDDAYGLTAATVALATWWLCETAGVNMSQSDTNPMQVVPAFRAEMFEVAGQATRMVLRLLPETTVPT